MASSLPSGHALGVASSSTSEVSKEIQFYSLFLLRLIQPLSILGIVALATFYKSLVDITVRIFAPNPNLIASATTRFGNNLSAGTAAASIAAGSNRSGYAPIPTQEETVPEPTPVVVPIRSRRRVLTFLIIGSLALTYLASGILIVLRAVLPPQQWIPDHPRWHAVEWQALL